MVPAEMVVPPLNVFPALKVKLPPPVLIIPPIPEIMPVTGRSLVVTFQAWVAAKLMLTAKDTSGNPGCAKDEVSPFWRVSVFAPERNVPVSLPPEKVSVLMFQFASRLAATLPLLKMTLAVPSFVGSPPVQLLGTLQLVIG